MEEPIDSGSSPEDAGVPDAGSNDAGVEDDAGISISLDGGSSSNPPPEQTTPSPTGGQDPCAPGATFAKGDVFRSIFSAGGLRWFMVHVPKDYDGKPVQLVMNFHGYSSDPLQQAALSKMSAAADQRGFIVAYPAGINRAWNAGQCCGDPAWVTKVDDVQFVRDAVEAISNEFCIDQRRIYSTGMSNGGFLSHRLACEASNLFAAIGPVAGVVGVPGCNPPRKVPVIHFHGTNDTLVPYYGGSSLGFPSVPVTYSAWLLRNACTGIKQKTYEVGDSTCETLNACPTDGETVLCTVQGGGHTWPGGTPVPGLGPTTTHLDATGMMLDFFAQHPMP